MAYFTQFYPTRNYLTQKDVDLFAEFGSCSRGKGWGLKGKESFQLKKKKKRATLPL